MLSGWSLLFIKLNATLIPWNTNKMFFLVLCCYFSFSSDIRYQNLLILISVSKSSILIFSIWKSAILIFGIKTLLIPKVVYTSFLLPTPAYIVKELNHLLLFNCSYNVNDLIITSQFYLELLKWWSEFREENVVVNDWHYTIWTNQDTGIDRNLFLFSYEISWHWYLKRRWLTFWLRQNGNLRTDCKRCQKRKKKKKKKTNFLEWTSMGHSIPPELSVGMITVLLTFTHLLKQIMVCLMWQ